MAEAQVVRTLHTDAGTQQSGIPACRVVPDPAWGRGFFAQHVLVKLRLRQRERWGRWSDRAIGGGFDALHEDSPAARLTHNAIHTAILSRTTDTAGGRHPGGLHHDIEDSCLPTGDTIGTPAVALDTTCGLYLAE
ncbi:hypothetical protein GCM10022381_06290 [Leifsonia kafniensis]|uniref:Uncharacterized protein n=1 Tax=Leifsonia kafniensis TaxID=475957 RepID=A0ABP7K6E5_9MICO